jgi:hypothetical protein
MSFQQRAASGALVLAMCALGIATIGSPTASLATFLLTHQDRWLLLAQGLISILLGQGLVARRQPLVLPRGGIVSAALIVVLFCYFGHLWALCGYDLSRDEQMAVFDSRIFSAGLRVQPLPPFWQQHVSALNTLFMLPVERPVAWVSGYLPVNALLRSLVGAVADPALTGPLLTAVGLVALHRCARLLWPEDREAALIACLLYLTSGQILLAGMTAFAMPAHLTFDLVWLWLFLLRRWWADGAALLIGFAATGLHQPLFHPLFAAPFLYLLLRDRTWIRIAFYGVGYAAICIFWAAWPGWTHALIAGPNSVAAAGISFWSRFQQLLADANEGRWVAMTANLLRFAAWQNLLLVPLMGLGVLLVRRDGMVAALLASILIPVAVMALIMPYQGFGFGYRYLHGVLGSAILLAVYGWRRFGAERGTMRSLLVRGSVATMIFLLPMQLWMAHRACAAFATLEARIAKSGTDYFAVGGSDASFAGTFIINRPDLTNRPLRLFAEALRQPFIAELCATRPRVGLPTSSFFAPVGAYFGSRPDPVADRRILRLGPVLRAAGCKVVVLGELPHAEG